MKRQKGLFLFGPKDHGVGIKPIHPIGWVLTVLLVVALAIGIPLAISTNHILGSLLIIISIITYTIIVAITLKKR